MRLKFLIIPSVLICQVTGAQNSTALTPAEGTGTISVSAAPSAPAASADSPATAASPAESESGQIAIIDYKSVYEAATLEEEVKMAAERFNLTAAQQDMWLTAATDRRAAEKIARDKLESKAANYERDGIYRGLRSAQNTFYETMIGYLTPAQKNAIETDRTILQEKQRRLAKLPPPPPPAPTVTVAPVDSAAIKESEKTKAAGKGTGKKSKKKKKAVG